MTREFGEPMGYGRIILSALLSTVCTLVLAACAAPPSPSPAPSGIPSDDPNQSSLTYRAVPGTPAHPAFPKGAPVATVLLFVAPDCPISNAYAPEIGRLVDEYGPRGVAFFAVYADPRVSEDDVRQHTSA